MNAGVRSPTARVCERCGRNERWNDRVDAWQLVTVDGDRQTGTPHCIHEWDINGTFSPVTGD